MEGKQSSAQKEQSGKSPKPANSQSSKKEKATPANPTVPNPAEKKGANKKPANPYKKSIERNKLNHRRREKSDKKRGLIS